MGEFVVLNSWFIICKLLNIVLVLSLLFLFNWVGIVGNFVIKWCDFV